MSLNIQMALKKRRLIIRLKGELDEANVSSLKKKVVGVIDKYKVIDLVFNFQDLTFLDSTGIGFIINRITEARKVNGKVVLCQMNETIARIYDISGLKRISYVAQDEQSADKLLEVLG